MNKWLAEVWCYLLKYFFLKTNADVIFHLGAILYVVSKNYWEKLI